MRKCWRRLFHTALALVPYCIFIFLTKPARPGDVATPQASYDVLANSALERAEKEAQRIRVLVEQGTLARVRLAEAEEAVADAKDEVVLSRTLYGGTHLQDMTSEEALTMVASAERRLGRQEKIVNDKRELVDAGILARSDFNALQDELNTRKRVLELATNRAKLLDDLRQMAESEKQLELANSLKSLMVRYDGNGIFRLTELTSISTAFERRFHRALPVSALGQTLAHQSMGLNHRDRVDVALNPDAEEGVWLRRLLERLRIPYLAFRGAIAGAATAPHIHIGPGSTRLALAAHSVPLRRE